MPDAALTVPVGLSRRTVVVGGVSAVAFQPLRARGVRRAARSDADELQRQLARTNTVHLTRTYEIDRPLVLSSGQRLTGGGEGKLVWVGGPGKPMICDSSVIEPRQVNRNISIEGIAIFGERARAAIRPRAGIDFYRTAGVTIRDVSARGIDGSAIRWGGSMVDTRDVLVERSSIDDSTGGDAIQGAGCDIIVRDNRIGSPQSTRRAFGDTGIALIADFSDLTNPTKSHSRGIAIVRNQIYGYGAASTSAKPPTGIAVGPFAADHDASLIIERNIVDGCYVNIWLVAMRGVRVARNVLRPHRSPLTGSLRLDGVSKFEIIGNHLLLSVLSKGADCSGILLRAGRFVFDASTFDCDVADFAVTGNVIDSISALDGIRMGFAEQRENPAFLSRMHSGRINGNVFNGVKRPIVFAPETGDPSDVCHSISVTDNRSDRAAAALIVQSGNPHQYRNINISRNQMLSKALIVTGTGAHSD